MKSKIRNISIYRWLGLAAAALSCLGCSAANVGESFPDLNKYDLEGKLPELKGKVVLVDFFASWCGPCKMSFPVMEDLEAKYKDKGFVVVAINVDKKKTDMENFLKKEKTSFAIVRDASTKLVAQVKVPTMPTSFILGRDGKIVAIHDGFHGDETRAKYVSEIENLLK